MRTLISQIRPIEIIHEKSINGQTQVLKMMKN